MKKGILAAFVAALALTAEIYAQTNDTGNMETKERIYGSVFPRGEKLPEMFAKYFTGQAYLARLTRDEAFAIRYHMGFSGTEDNGTVGKALEMFPLAFALSVADMEAAYFMEGKDPDEDS
mgnify:CR=1 FL=1